MSLLISNENYGDLIKLPDTVIFHSHKSKNTIWYGNESGTMLKTRAQELPDSDVSNYILFDAYSWIYSNGNIYKQNELIYRDIDEPVQIKDGYFLSRNKIFWIGKEVVYLDDVNSVKFKKYNLSSGDYYTDGTYFIYKNNVVTVDFSTLQVFSSGTFKDNNNVFINGRLQENAESSTFQQIYEPYYYKDAINIYYAPNPGIIIGADPDTFTVFVGDPRYSKDESSVYYTSSFGEYSYPIKIEGADPATFVLVPYDDEAPLTNYDAFDENYYFDGIERVGTR